jgi:hypothetical protein
VQGIVMPGNTLGMTISSTTRIAGPFTGTGLQTAFPFSFKVFQASDVLVILTDLSGNIVTQTLNSQYTVTLNANQNTAPGGTVTMVTPPPTGYTLAIGSQVPALQPSDLTNAGNFYPQVVNDALDRLTILLQQSQQGRSISVPEITGLPLLPAAAARANLLLGFDSNGNPVVTAPASGSVAAFAMSLISSIGTTLVGMILSLTGAAARTLQSWIGDFPVTPQGFGAKGDGVTDDSAAFTAMWATNRPWYIPYTASGYLVNAAFAVNADGVCDGKLIAKAGFAGKLITICNPNYGVHRTIYGLSVYSTDVRPSPYTGAATWGLYVGPTAGFVGNTPCSDVSLINCKAHCFSVGALISTFNVNLYSCQIFQNDHNVQLYSTDLTANQINDIRLMNCVLDSAASSVGQAYALRIGTTGNATYASNTGMGYSISIQNTNFDGAPVFVDNVIGITIGGPRSYCEQGSGYTYHGGAIVLGSAGANTLQDCTIQGVTFNQFDYAVVEKNTVLGLVVGPNNCSAVKYRELLAVGCEAQGFIYRRGSAVGSFNANGDPVGTNFSSGISTSQITFNSITIDSDFLINGVQVAPTKAATTSWYPKGLTLDGSQNLGSSVGRFRTGAAVQTAIAGNQVGQVFTFTTQLQASLFTGGDSISSSAGGASKILSVDYVAGTAVLDSTFTGAATLTHATAYFVGYNLIGNGSPNGAVTDNPGARYSNLSGGAGTTLYVKESGVGTNTGWVAK